MRGGPSARIQRNYLLLTALNTLATSFIWGINTLFLLDAGLNNAEAFAANAFFTLGLVLFEVPTGVVADTRGRRTSYLLGTSTLALSTALYLWMWHVHAPFWAWAASSVLLGVGYTFFSGAVQAWLVDALTFHGYFREGGKLESVLARGEIVDGSAMLVGSVAGGYIAQATNLGVPFLLRAFVLGLSFLLALWLMKDVGFEPRRTAGALREVRSVLASSLKHGLGHPPVRWVMLAAPLVEGVNMYVFYAMQPYLLELYGDPSAYGIAGLAAAIIAGTQIVGGLLVPLARRVARRRTSVMLTGVLLGGLLLILMGLLPQFWIALGALVLGGLASAVVTPVRQAYLNALISSEHRATVLSFDSLLGSAGGVVTQPALGRAADVWGYPLSYSVSGLLQLLALPLLWAARRERSPADPTREERPPV